MRPLPRSERFEFRAPLGEGAHGLVYEAFDRERQELVAVKLLHRPDAESIFQLKREFRALADVVHPNLVRLYDLVCDEAEALFSMELIRGREVQVQEELRALGAETEAPAGMSFREACRIAAPLIEGVGALHDRGLVHRDLKPSNIRLGDDGRVVLLDFGTVLQRRRSEQGAGGLVGTPAYMAPEVCAGRLAGDESSDWYSVGCVLYEALTGVLPVDGSTYEILQKKTEVDPVPLSTLRRDLPEDFSQAVMDLLCRDPTGRIAAARKLRARIDRTLEYTPPQGLSSIPSTGAVFVGRETELDVLNDALEGSRQGRCTSLHLSGAAGMGKTALIDAFVSRCPPNTVVLRGRCFLRESVAFKGLDGVVDSLSDYLTTLSRSQLQRVLPESVKSLCRVFPVLKRVKWLDYLRKANDLASDPTEVRRRGFAALHEIVSRIATHRPVTIVVDDLQWANDDSAALLGALSQPRQGPQPLVITSARSEIERDTRLGELANSAQVQLPLEPLAPEHASALAGALLGANHERRVAQIVAEAKGHALFIREMARLELPQDSAAHITLAGMLAERIRQQNEASQALLRVLAVSGGPTALNVLLAASGARYTAVDALEAQRLVRMMGTDGTRVMDTTADTVREVVMSGLEPQPLVRLHMALAEALVAHQPDAHEQTALHFNGGGAPTQARDHALRAAEEAERALAFDGAARMYQIALKDPTMPVSQRAAVLQSLGQAYANAGRCGASGEAYLAASEHAEGVLSLDYRRQAAEQFLFAGYVDRGTAVALPLTKELGLLYPDSTASAIVATVGSRLRLHLRSRMPKLGTRQPESSPLELLRIDTCWSLSCSLALADTLVSASFSARCLELAHAAGEPHRLASILCVNAVHLAAAKGPQHEKALGMYAQAEAAAELSGDARAMGGILLCQSARAHIGGEHEAALRFGNEGHQLLTDQTTGGPWERSLVEGFIVWSLFYLGRLRDLRVQTDRFMEVAKSHGNVYVANALRAPWGVILWLAQDDLPGARRELREALEGVSQARYTVQTMRALFARAMIDLYAGQEDEGLETMQAEWKLLRRAGILRLGLFRKQLSMFRATMELAVGVKGHAKNLLTALKFADIADRTQLRGARAWADLVRGLVYAARGKRQKAQRVLQESLEALETKDLHLIAACARYRLGELVDGDEGAALRTKSLAYFESEGVVQPLKVIRIFAPAVRRDAETV